VGEKRKYLNFILLTFPKNNNKITNMNLIATKSISRITLNTLLIICVIIGTILNAIKFGFISTISYFTIQSNLLCLVAGIITILLVMKKNDPKDQKYIFIKGMSLAAILLTFFVYNFVLRPYLDAADSNRVESIESILLHIIAPLIMFLDFLFFEEKGQYKIWYPFGWALFPVFYIVYTAVYKAFGGLYTYSTGIAKFPYFFLDYETYGYKTVGLWVLLITAGFIGFSFLLLGLSNLLLKLRKIS